ncbi:C40 family peptidase [Larkinella arboricola]|uniref:NlpC/P60 family protein n=1 Tax=Larkinella arboricola TaxID=643671 RepID=A0A327WW04_LARAB|nr:C40 family peptidase [Larkinella arboricola]RAJ95625.1 NlpC/P60 family protein [Larkinella arboricola]
MIRKVLLTALCVVSFGIAQAHRPLKKIVKKHPALQPVVADSAASDSAFYDHIPLVHDILSYAKKHLSSRYRSGGASPRGFDCSGFTRFCYRKFGISLPHSSAAQGRVGVKIGQEVAKPGDLIFFKGQSSRSKRIGHVGMIVEVVGDRIKFIHSAWNGGVRYDWLHAQYYKRRFMGIRRVVS